jgi:hypothetical protein
MGKEKTLIIGGGEIGKSLKNVLDPYYDVYIRDIDVPAWDTPESQFRVIHIPYPFFDSFVSVTQQYIRRYRASVCIVHSTVPPGTTASIGTMAVHSPVNGRHPNLEEGIRTFVKFVGGTDVYTVFDAVRFLNVAGLRTHVFSSSNATELAKIMCTTQLGWFVVLMKEIAAECEKQGVPFHEVYTEWNNAYNEGYSALGEMRFMRPNMFPMDGPIGGHCVINNCGLLENFLTETVKGRNQLYLSGRMILESRPTGGRKHRVTENRSLKNDKPKRANRKRN